MKKFRKNKKGFTLVEIIVVLVILAILAAAAIPTMLGFVNDAKGKAEIANARSVYIAAQTIAAEESATGATSSTLPTAVTAISANTRLNALLGSEEYAATATVWVKVGAVDTTEAGKIQEIRYNNNGYTVIIKPNAAAEVVKEDTLTIPAVPET